MFSKLFWKEHTDQHHVLVVAGFSDSRIDIYSHFLST